MSARHRASYRFVVAFAAAWLVAGVVAARDDCSRVVAVGDLHGGYEAFVQILRETRLVDDALDWAGEQACLVQLGDVVDRGARSREILDLLRKLDQQAGGRVEVLLGNHEAMTLIGDLRYVAPGEHEAFAADESPAERDAAFESYVLTAAAQAAGRTELREQFDRQFPPGWIARRRAFSAEGEYGMWLLERPTVARFGRSVFVHGGLTTALASRGIAGINSLVSDELRAFMASRIELEKAGWLDPFVSYADSFQRVIARASPPEADDRAARYLAYPQAISADSRGPLWYRGLAEGDERLLGGEVESILDTLEADRLIMGHTTSADGSIRQRFSGRVFLIDTGAGPAYTGRVSALEIDSGGAPTAIYEGERVELRATQLTDRRLERALSEGEIVEMKEIGIGVTKPLKVTLRFEGETLTAAFKAISQHESGATRFERGGPEIGFSDDFLYEVAAYRLDRMLSMRRVPVAVLRTLDGQPGALVAWVHDAINETQRLAESVPPIEAVDASRQMDVMRVFDALIGNSDRNLGNLLWTPADGKLHLIDHTRAFRLSKKLPEGMAESIIALPRWLYDAMVALDQEALRVQLDSLITGARFRAMIARRDRLLREIDRDVAEFGAASVFHAVVAAP